MVQVWPPKSLALHGIRLSPIARSRRCICTSSRLNSIHFGGEEWAPKKSLFHQGRVSWNSVNQLPDSTHEDSHDFTVWCVWCVLLTDPNHHSARLLKAAFGCSQYQSIRSREPKVCTQRLANGHAYSLFNWEHHRCSHPYPYCSRSWFHALGRASKCPAASRKLVLKWWTLRSNNNCNRNCSLLCNFERKATPETAAGVSQHQFFLGFFRSRCKTQQINETSKHQ